MEGNTVMVLGPDAIRAAMQMWVDENLKERHVVKEVTQCKDEHEQYDLETLRIVVARKEVGDGRPE